MPNPFRYRRVLHDLARLSGPSYPPRVQLVAAGALAWELIPGSPRADLIRRMLQEANPVEFARHKLRDLYDRADPTVLTSAQEPPTHTSLEEENPPEEDDDPL